MARPQRADDGLHMPIMAGSLPAPGNKRSMRCDPVDIHVGLQIKRLRRSQRISQDALGASVGLSFQQVQKYENGNNRVSASKLYAIARTLSVPISAFFDGLPETCSRAKGGDDRQ